MHRLLTHRAGIRMVRRAVDEDRDARRLAVVTAARALIVAPAVYRPESIALVAAVGKAQPGPALAWVDRRLVLPDAGSHQRSITGIVAGAVISGASEQMLRGYSARALGHHLSLLPTERPSLT
jgi:hypothetical protein